MKLAQYHHFANNLPTFHTTALVESSLPQIDGNYSDNTLQLGHRLGTLLGTCNAYGQPTELSYPLDRFIGYIYTQSVRLKEFIFSHSNLDVVSDKNDFHVQQVDGKNNEQVEEISRGIDMALMQMQPIFAKFHMRMQEELEIAKSKGKPLLLLIGESHYSLHSALMEASILIITSKLNNFTFSHVFTESFEADYYSNSKDMPWPSLIVEKILNFLNKVKIPMDLGTCDVAPRPIACRFVDNKQLMKNKKIDKKAQTSVAGMKKRNYIMAKVMQTLKNHSIAIVGQSHLYGLMQETDLQDVYHIFPVALAPHLTSFLHEPLRTLEENIECEQKYIDVYFAFTNNKDTDVFPFPDKLGFKEFFDCPYSSEMLLEKILQHIQLGKRLEGSRWTSL